METADDGRTAVWGSIDDWQPPLSFHASWHPGTTAMWSTELRVAFKAVGERHRAPPGSERMGRRRGPCCDTGRISGRLARGPGPVRAVHGRRGRLSLLGPWAASRDSLPVARRTGARNPQASPAFRAVLRGRPRNVARTGQERRPEKIARQLADRSRVDRRNSGAGPDHEAGGVFGVRGRRVCAAVEPCQQTPDGQRTLAARVLVDRGQAEDLPSSWPSMPMTERSCGTRRPKSLAARMVPMAISSEAAKTAVGRPASCRAAHGRWHRRPGS